MQQQQKRQTRNLAGEANYTANRVAQCSRYCTPASASCANCASSHFAGSKINQFPPPTLTRRSLLGNKSQITPALALNSALPHSRLRKNRQRKREQNVSQVPRREGGGGETFDWKSTPTCIYTRVYRSTAWKTFAAHVKRRQSKRGEHMCARETCALGARARKFQTPGMSERIERVEKGRVYV